MIKLTEEAAKKVSSMLSDAEEEKFFVSLLSRVDVLVLSMVCLWIFLNLMIRWEKIAGLVLPWMVPALSTCPVPKCTLMMD